MNYNEIMVAQAKSRVLRELGIDKETTKTVVLPETVGITYDSTPFGHFFPPISLTVGEKYVVVFNGTVYHCTCYKFNGPDGIEQLILGNMLTPNTGEPFAISSAMGGDTPVVPIDPGTGSPVNLESVTLEIYQEATTTTPIKLEYLPGVCLPVVELETVLPDFNDGTVTISGKDKTALNTMFNARTPIILRCTDSEGFIRNGVAMCVSWVDDPESGGYQMNFPDGGFVAFDVEHGEWTMATQG